MEHNGATEDHMVLSPASSVNEIITFATVNYCGRPFSVDDIQAVRNIIASYPDANRRQLSRLVCERLNWLRPDGRSKEMSCRVAMLRMQRDSLITLPVARGPNVNNRKRLVLTKDSDAQAPVLLPAHLLGVLRIEPVNKKTSSLWNQLIDRYHYLGYKPIPGAQMRYFVYCQNNQLLAVLSFGASAWKVKPRDTFIGWTQQQRISNLHLIVNNSRFLILPWVSSKNLASRILGLLAKRIADDWQACYKYRPLLLETFVQKDRFRGTCYRAANWIHVGQTQGRGKLDSLHLDPVPVKDIFLYPLSKNFRQSLCA